MAVWIKGKFFRGQLDFSSKAYFEVGKHCKSRDEKYLPVLFRKLEFGNVGFYGGRKTGEPGEKPSKQGREPTTNSTHI